MVNLVSFPGLGLEFQLNRIAFTVLGRPIYWYGIIIGFGFLLAAMVFAVVAALRLDYFTKKLPYYILSVQSLVAEDRSGLFTRLGVFLEERFERR